MPERIVVIGGNSAGMAAAGRARRLDPDLDILILEMSHFISYSICGLPYYVCGLVEKYEDLIAFTPERLELERGIRSRLRVRANEILPGRRVIACSEMDGPGEFEIPYDRAVIATGYIPRVPAIEGAGLENVLAVSRLEDGIRIRRLLEGGCRRAVVVGAGYIGLMMAHGLRSLGLEVLLLERGRQVFDQIDGDMAKPVQEELERNGVKVVLETPVSRLRGEAGRFSGVEVRGKIRPADLALIDIGVQPNTLLAETSGIPLGISGAVLVDERGQSAWAGIYAAGNCAETRHLVTGKPIFSALATSASRQGRVVGENLAGLRSLFSGTLETSVEKVFELCIARTGLTTAQAVAAGFEVGSVRITDRDRSAYYPGSREIQVKLIYEKPGGRLLGGQIIGGESAGKRIDTLATALTARMTLHDLAHLDLSYAPPYGTLWDPIQIAANVGLRGMWGRMKDEG